MEIDYLCIGHCCHDQTDDGFILGGTASYASLVANKLGRNTALLTSVGSDFLYEKYLTDHRIKWYNVPADQTTIFENIYTSNGRKQYIHAVAAAISQENVPAELSHVPIVHIGSIAREIDYGIFSHFQSSLIGATIQGFIREWDHTGLVRPKSIDWSQLNGIDVVILSNDDIKGLDDALSGLYQYVTMVVMTRGKDGATIYIDETEYHLPAYPVTEVEATGAGDVYSTAFLIAYQQSGDAVEAGIYAHCAASFVVEGIGINNLPSSTELEERIKEYKALYSKELQEIKV